MKKTAAPIRLTLSKHTLRHLSGGHLERAAGAARNTGGPCSVGCQSIMMNCYSIDIPCDPTDTVPTAWC